MPSNFSDINGSDCISIMGFHIATSYFLLNASWLESSIEVFIYLVSISNIVDEVKRDSFAFSSLI